MLMSLFWPRPCFVDGMGVVHQWPLSSGLEDDQHKGRLCVRARVWSRVSSTV